MASLYIRNKGIIVLVDEPYHHDNNNQLIFLFKMLRLPDFFAMSPFHEFMSSTDLEKEKEIPQTDFLGWK